MNILIGDRLFQDNGHTTLCGKVSQKSAQGRRKIGGRKNKKIECGPIRAVAMGVYRYIYPPKISHWKLFCPLIAADDIRLLVAL